jgi:hypothetical protein
MAREMRYLERFNAGAVGMVLPQGKYAVAREWPAPMAQKQAFGCPRGAMKQLAA